MKFSNSDIINIFNFRYACKKFDAQKKISEADFNTILDSARLSPSSFGFEPWKFLIIEKQELKDKLFPISWGGQNSLKGASHFVIILARKKADMVVDSPYISHIMKDIKHMPDDIVTMMRQAYSNFLGNDFKILEDEQAMFDWASKQTYIALANMMTVGAMLGIDSCPIEGFNLKAVEELLAAEGLLDLDHFGVSVMAGFGYRDEEPHREKTRQPLHDIVQWVK
ncbi:NAD(P)H-dependent oxidoreductase [uncultured Veillonella sp.]|uniref:NAD(P)H-dependent oxidoreductase n=1 Tax=uncultured Veillonella sp. TaxID=159268 RepID=UPI002627687D|nr:NAD(P)H-dependent oxidoreductase [uncultured Veillonella sp.]